MLAGALWWGPVGSGAQQGPPDPAADEPVVVVDDTDFSDPAEGLAGLGPEVRGLRSALSSTFATDVPGVFTRQVFDEPVNFQGPSGNWRRVDTTLVARDDTDGFRVKANSPRVEIAESADAAELSAVELSDGARAAVSLEGAEPAAASVEGSSATFADAVAGVDVVLEAVPSGLKETLVLADASAPREFTFGLDLDGLVTEVDAESGEVVLRDAPEVEGGEPGEPRLRVPPGFMVDSAVDPAFSQGVTYTLVELAGGGQGLRVTLDEAFLDDPGRVWPVRVDPSLLVYSQDATDDTYVVEGESGVFHNSESALNVGWSGSAKQRALVGFSIGVYADVDVHFAEVVLSPVGGCPGSVPLTLAPATTAWSGGSVSWPGPTTGSQLLPDATGYGMFCVDGKVHAQVTPVVQDWVDGTSTSRGFVLAAQDETDGSQLRSFASNNDSMSGNRPHLDITYTLRDASSPPDAPSDLSPSGDLTTLNPTLVARYTHSGGEAGSLLFAVRIAGSDLVLGYGFFVDGSNTPVTLPSGIRGALVVGGGLPADVELEWRATSYWWDGTEYRWSPPASWQPITTPATAAGCSGTADPGEQNDTRANATPWDGTSEVDGLVCADPDVFVLTATGSPDVEVTVDFDGDADLDVAVYDDAGAVVALLDSTDPSETYVFGDAGTFYVEVYGYRGASGGYSLTGETL